MCYDILKSIPETDFHHFSEADDSDSNSNSSKNQIFVLAWNRFWVLESIQKSDIYLGYDSDSNSSKNGIITALQMSQFRKNPKATVTHPINLVT